MFNDEVIERILRCLSDLNDSNEHDREELWELVREGAASEDDKHECWICDQMFRALSILFGYVKSWREV